MVFCKKSVYRFEAERHRFTQNRVELNKTNKYRDKFPVALFEPRKQVWKPEKRRHKENHHSDGAKNNNCHNNPSVSVVRLTNNVEVRNSAERERGNEKSVVHLRGKFVEIDAYSSDNLKRQNVKQKYTSSRQRMRYEISDESSVYFVCVRLHRKGKRTETDNEKF